MTERHCESCGSTDTENLDHGDQGYTACCNELVCHGMERDRFGIATDFMVACCWAKADKKFEAEGREAPEGSSRLWEAR